MSFFLPTSCCIFFPTTSKGRKRINSAAHLRHRMHSNSLGIAVCCSCPFSSSCCAATSFAPHSSLLSMSSFGACSTWLSAVLSLSPAAWSASNLSLRRRRTVVMSAMSEWQGFTFCYCVLLLLLLLLLYGLRCGV